MERDPARANKFPLDSPELKFTEKPWTTITPKKAKNIPKTVTTGKRLFKTNSSKTRVNSGAVVPNKVALEILVSLTAEKNNAK